MRKLILGICCIGLMAVGMQAQEKIASSWSCDKPSVQHSLDVGDMPGHTYSIAQVKCTATKGELGGVKEKEGTGTEFHDTMGDRDNWHGTFVEVLASGDKVYYSYKGSGSPAKGISDTWTVAGGTGKSKGATGKGSCKGKGSPDGSANLDCTGSYESAKAAAPAKKE